MKRLWHSILRLVCFGLLLLIVCTMQSHPGPLTARDEAAIYNAVFYEIGGRDMVLASEMNRWNGPGPTTSSCKKSGSNLIREMPATKEELMPAFCALNHTSRPINPAIVDLLKLEIHDPDTATNRGMVRVSGIQTDSKKNQALVFVEVRGDGFMHGGYFLLMNYYGIWIVRYETIVYAS